MADSDSRSGGDFREAKTTKTKPEQKQKPYIFPVVIIVVETRCYTQETALRSGTTVNSRVKKVKKMLSRPIAITLSIVEIKPLYQSVTPSLVCNFSSEKLLTPKSEFNTDTREITGEHHFTLQLSTRVRRVCAMPPYLCTVSTLHS